MTRTYYIGKVLVKELGRGMIGEVMNKYDGYFLLFLADITRGTLFYPLTLVRKYMPMLRAYYGALRGGIIAEGEPPDDMYRELVRYISRSHNVESVVFDGVLGRQIIVRKVPIGALRMKYLLVLVNAYKELTPDDVKQLVGVGRYTAKKMLRTLNKLGYLKCRGNRCIATSSDIVFRAYKKMNNLMDAVNYWINKLRLMLDPEYGISIQEYVDKYRDPDKYLRVAITNVGKKIRALGYVKKYALAINRRDTAELVDKAIELMLGYVEKYGETRIILDDRIGKAFEWMMDEYAYIRCKETSYSRLKHMINYYCRRPGVVGAILRYHGVCRGVIDELEGIARYLGIPVEDKCELLEKPSWETSDEEEVDVEIETGRHGQG